MGEKNFDHDVAVRVFRIEFGIWLQHFDLHDWSFVVDDELSDRAGTLESYFNFDDKHVRYRLPNVGSEIEVSFLALSQVLGILVALRMLELLDNADSFNSEQDLLAFAIDKATDEGVHMAAACLPAMRALMKKIIFDSAAFDGLMQEGHA